MIKKKTFSMFTIVAVICFALIGCASGGDEVSTKDANTPPATSSESGMTATGESDIQSAQPTNAGDAGGLGK